MIRQLAILALLISVTQPLLGQNTFYNTTYNNEGSRLAMTSMTSEVPSSGYLAVRVEAVNREKVPVNWRFDFTSKDRPWTTNRNELSSSFSLSCDGGESKTVEFLVPLVSCVADYGEPTLEVDITATPPLSDGSADISSEKDRLWPEIIMSEALATPNLGPLQSYSGKRSSVRRRSSSEFAASFLPRELSSDWRAYSGVDIIMLTGSDWMAAPAGARNAMLQWNRLGGRLLIYTSAAASDLGSLGIEPDGQGSSSGRRTWGEVERIASTGLLLDPAATYTLVEPKGRPSYKRHLLSKNYRKSWPLQDRFGTRDFNAVFFILILIAFAIIVGPVNIFVFAKAKQRHRLFVTTPLISLAASLLLIIVIFLQDGIGGKGQRVTLVESRPDENRLYLQQEQIARTGVLFGTGFTLPDDAVLSPIILPESPMARVTRENDGGSARYRVQRNEGGKSDYRGDWFQSRSEYGHYLTSIRTSRGRLELQPATGNPTLSSTFDFPVEKLYYRDSSERYWTNSAPLTSGRKVTLQQATQGEYERWFRTLQNRLIKDSKGRLRKAARGPNHFVATTGSGPFIETLPSVDWTESLAIITGTVVTP